MVLTAEQIEKVVTTAQASARKTYTAGRGRLGFRYSKDILDNPYHLYRKEHVIWHNAFYAECRRMPRRIK
jgi:hypothetical protein